MASSTTTTTTTQTTTSQSEEADTAPPSRPPLTPISSDFSIRKTVYGGRGCFAVNKIPKGSVVLVCNRPLAFTITRDFKKEVCNWCFRYDNGNTMKTRLSCKNGTFSIHFCSTQCLQFFKQYDQEGLLLSTLLSIERLQVKELESDVPEVLTRTTIDKRWGEIQQWGLKLPTKLSKREKFVPLYIDEATYDDLKYIAVLIFEKIKNQNNELEYFEALQSNEYEKMMRFPQLLETSILIFQVLKLIFPLQMQPFITTSFIRDTLGKESGNAFGIWSPQINDEYQEYLGFGLYPSASFFNHSCCPNVLKKRIDEKLVFTTLKDIEPNEELYINYGSTTEKDFTARQESLKEWFFDCACDKCRTDEFNSLTAKLKL